MKRPGATTPLHRHLLRLRNWRDAGTGQYNFLDTLINSQSAPTNFHRVRPLPFYRSTNLAAPKTLEMGRRYPIAGAGSRDRHSQADLDYNDHKCQRRDARR